MAKTRSVSKAGRLLLLYLLREHELLGDELSQAEIARWLGVNRSTVHKDLRVMDDVLAAYHELWVTQPWVRWRDGRAEAGVLADGQNALEEMHWDGTMQDEGDSEAVSDGDVHEGRVWDARTVTRADVTP